MKYEEEMNKPSRSELIRQARLGFNSRDRGGLSLFKFHEPKLSEDREEKKAEQYGHEPYTDTLKLRIILTTVLFLLLFILSCSGYVPDFNEQLRDMISDNSIVEEIYSIVSR